jgi:transcriptional regulator with XRE-family HTH domain
MTFGEKFSSARKQAGLSQQQCAEKLGVSRSAIAKWEVDLGMPDVDNLKAISQLLSVSVDYLLEEDETINFQTIREPINLDEYPKTGKCRDRRDAACYGRNQDAEAIYPLIRRKKMTFLEAAVDFIVQPGIMQIADYLEDGSAYYLVERKGRQYLVSVSSECICTTELAAKVDPRKFIVGNHVYRKSTYRLI